MKTSTVFESKDDWTFLNISTQDYTHGFHLYPARMHPEIAKRIITKEDYQQMQRYLKGAQLELGLIINFRDMYLKPKRVLNVLADPNNIDNPK